MITHIDFHISYRCVNRCVFCSSADSIRKFKSHPLTYNRIAAVLRRKAKYFNSVNFTGGEPSLLKFLPALARKTRKLGYKVYVGSNGAGFADKDFCGKAAPFIDEICFSVHGHTARLHNFHTRNKNSFENLNKALDNLAQSRVRLLSNTVVTKYNFPYLKDILRFAVSKKIKQALISNLAPEGRGLDNYRNLVVRLKDIRKKVPQLVKIAQRERIALRFFGLPACILGNFAVHSNDFFWDARLNIEQDKKAGRFIIKEERAYFPERARIKVEKCKACFYEKICGGVFEEYYKIFKDGELRPVKK